MRQTGNTKRIGAMWLCCAMLALSACSGGDDSSDKTDKSSNQAGGSGKAAPAQLEAFVMGDATPSFRCGDIYLSGQPSAADLKKLAKAGLQTVISLRMPEKEDVGFDEQAVVEQLGIKFHNPAFSSADELQVPVFDIALSYMSAQQKRPMLIHCASGNRVGAIWLAYRVIHDGVAYDRALEEARRIGMNAQTYEATVLAYLKNYPDDLPLNAPPDLKRQ